MKTGKLHSGVALIVLIPLLGSVNRATPPEAAKLIQAGRSVGYLKLGDSRERALQIFPKKANTDIEYDIPNCGTEYDWVELRPIHRGGNVFINFKGGRVWQISSTLAEFATVNGIKSGSSPQDVRRQFKGLESYVYRGRTPEALHQSPLIVWVDRPAGIAFSFVYSSEETSSRFMQLPFSAQTLRFARHSVASFLRLKPGRSWNRTH